MAHADPAGQPPVEPDTKDWTWVLDRPCPECGLDAADVEPRELGRLLRDSASSWSVALEGPAVTDRPAPGVWSVTEYACHVRDVHLVFAERLRLMLDQDDPEFANWDQDATAVERRYDLADPADVTPQLVAAAHAVAGIYDAMRDDQWSRKGRRSNGHVFTVDSLGRYHLHDVVHHLWDVTGTPVAADGTAACG